MKKDTSKMVQVLTWILLGCALAFTLFKILFGILNLKENSGAIQAFAEILLVLLGVIGLTGWKLKSDKKIDNDVARRYLKSALQLRDAINYVRNPFISVGEMERARKEQGLDENIHDNKTTNIAVYSSRWKKIQEAWSNFEAEALNAEVYWGKPAVEVGRPLLAKARELFAEVQMYLDGERRPIKETILYNTGSVEAPDDFSNQMNVIIDNLKKFLEQYLD